MFSRTLFIVLSILLLSCSGNIKNTDIVAQNKKMSSAQANTIFDRMFDEHVDRQPETQTYLGIKKDYGKWDDISDEFALATNALNEKQLAELKQMNTSEFDAQTKLSWALMKNDLEEEIDDFKWRFHNYPVNQMFGVHSSIPALLINAHSIDSQTDAEAYIQRIKNIPKKIDQLIQGLKKREVLGIVAPKFVFAYVINDCKNLIKGAPFKSSSTTEDSTLLADFKKKTDALANKGQLISRVTRALNNDLEPAYQRLINYLQITAVKVKDNHGIWAVTDGEAFYKVALKRTTTTDLSSDEIHQIGLDGIERIHDEMRSIMKKVKFKGDLKEFFTYMREDEKFYYKNTEAGRAAYLERTHKIIGTMESRLDELFITKPQAPLDVKAVEPFREKSAGKAFYQQPSPDGSRPGRYYVNLYEMKDMPWYQLEALAYHEGLPGHHMQIAIAQELKGVPKFRRYGRYTAYVEGWGLYSEKIPKSMGLYSDPYSDFGRLAMELWRAGRLVVDTGLHAKKWTREQAIQYLVDNTPNSERDCTRAIERYMVMPSQATAYYIGMEKILDLRSKAKQALGDDFDIRAFHDLILANGALPLSLLEEQVDGWIKASL